MPWYSEYWNDDEEFCLAKLSDLEIALYWFMEKKNHIKVYSGERELKSYHKIRAVFNQFNGEFSINFTEIANLDDLLKYDKYTRSVKGLHPMTVQEFVAYALVGLNVSLVHPTLSFTREVLLRFIEQSFLHDELPLVVACLDAWGF